jgi:hypothetical protein
MRAAGEASLGSTKMCGGLTTLGASSFAVLVFASGVSFEVAGLVVFLDRVFMAQGDVRELLEMLPMFEYCSR